MKYVMIAVASFLAVGLITEQLVNVIVEKVKENEPQVSSQARFVEAQRSGTTIDAPSQAQPASNTQHEYTRLQKSDCTAETIAKAHPHMIGKVIDVIDGDTIVVTVEGAFIEVRLWGVDAPEKEQPDGQKAWQALINHAPLNTKIYLYPMDMDMYGHMVANIGYASEFAVNFTMAAQGMAYHVNDFSSAGNRCLAEAQKMARNSLMGVWRQGENGGERPWHYRQRITEQNQQEQEQEKEEPTVTDFN